MYRYKKSIPLSYERQGVIYFYSLLYRELDTEQQGIIRKICRTAGGEHYRALLEYVTGGEDILVVCRRHYISRSTLLRAVKRYYIAMEDFF